MSGNKKNWQELQADFAAVIRGVDSDILAEDCKAGKISLADRMGIYRGNTRVSLVDVLAAGFPVCMELVGEEFFKNMAHVFVRDNLPEKPQLFTYGADFAEFIGGFAPAKSVPYLADTARLEWARNEVYFAADAAVLTGQELGKVATDKLDDLCFKKHPAARLVVSSYPLHEIWVRHQGDWEGSRKIAPEIWAAAPFTILVTRPYYKRLQVGLERGAAAFIRATWAGESFCRAAALAEAAESDMDLQNILATCLEQGAFSTLKK